MRRGRSIHSNRPTLTEVIEGIGSFLWLAVHGVLILGVLAVVAKAITGF